MNQEQFVEALASALNQKDLMPIEGPVTMTQVAKYFQVTPKTIGTWVEEKPTFPRPVNFGKSLRWDAKEVRSYWASIAKN